MARSHRAASDRSARKVELELPGVSRHELIVYRVAPESPVAKGERIPRWARPSLVVRDDRSMRIHEAGRPQPGDNVYIFAAARFVPLLDRLFASPAALTEKDLDYFGEFSVDPERPIGDLAKLYGVEIAEEDAALSIGDYLAMRLGAPPGRGDRLPVAPIELIVREVDEKGAPVSVGLALEPSDTSAPKLPIFQNLSQIVAAARWRLARPSTPARSEPIVLEPTETLTTPRGDQSLTAGEEKSTSAS